MHVPDGVPRRLTPPTPTYGARHPRSHRQSLAVRLPQGLAGRKKRGWLWLAAG